MSNLSPQWKSLDDSIWERIFRYLPLKSRIRSELVCRHWCKTLRSKRLWTRLCVSFDEEIAVECGPNEITELVSHSALGAPRKPLVNGLNFWARFSPIREIDLNCVTLRTESPIRYLQVLGHCKKLEVLKMSNLRSRKRPIFFLSKDFRKINEFVLRSDKLRFFEIDARVQSQWSTSSLRKWLDPWQWHTIIDWLKSPQSIIRVVNLEIKNLPISAFAKLPNNRETYFEDYVHPFVNLRTLGEAVAESNIVSLSMGRGCALGDKGALLLMESILTNTSIRCLKLQRCQITSSGVRQIGDKVNRGLLPLNILDLRFNVVQRDAAADLEKALLIRHPNAELLV